MVAKQDFETRQVGRTNLRMTTLGCGSATAASIFQEVPDQQARDTIGHALDVGIGYIDTAPQYGYGRAEHLVGDALRFRPEKYVLSTKVGRLLRPIRHEGEREYSHAWVKPFPFEQVYDYSYDGVMRSVEDSMQRMGLSKVDILLVHDIGVMTHGEEVNAPLWQQLVDGGYRALSELKNAGVCSAIGLGTNEWEVQLKAFDIGDWDIFLLAGRYTLLEQTSLDPFLSTCLKRGASVIAGAPFNGGALMGTGKWNYGAAPAEIVARVKALEDFCKEWNVPIGAAALQFPLAHQAVCNVLAGPRSPDEIDGILAWWNTPIPADFWTALAEKKLVAEGTPLPGGKTA